VQSAALDVRQIVTFVIGHEIDGRPFRQSGRLIEDQSPVLDACSKRAHTVYRTAFIDTRQALRPEPRDVGLAKRGRDPAPDLSLEASHESQRPVRAQPRDERSLQNVSKTRGDLSGIAGDARGR
jgi:hypothetical protein